MTKHPFEAPPPAKSRTASTLVARNLVQLGRAMFARGILRRESVRTMLQNYAGLVDARSPQKPSLRRRGWPKILHGALEGHIRSELDEAGRIPPNFGPDLMEVVQVWSHRGHARSASPPSVDRSKSPQTWRTPGQSWPSSGQHQSRGGKQALHRRPKPLPEQPPAWS